MDNACNISYSRVSMPDQAKASKTLFQKQVGYGGTDRPYLKSNPKSKRTGTVVQVVECLPEKHKPLSSIPNTTKKKKGKRSVYLHPPPSILESDIPRP
jgi:hypothetical protein